MKKILIVDDDADLRITLSEILKEAGYYVDNASSGSEAIEKAATEAFDIVLLDVMMPEMNGIDVLKELRKIRPKTRVIMITAFATVKSAVDAIKRGASDYISKPFNIDELLAIIGQVLEEARFEEGIKKSDVEHALSALSNPLRRTILQLLYSGTNMRLKEITKELNMPYEHTKVVFHLKALKEAGLINQDKEKSYALTKEGEKALDLLNVFEKNFPKS